MPKILAFAGSARKDSVNRKLVHIAAEGARTKGVEVTEIDLKDYPLPIFDQDLETEQGLPENARKLKALFLDHAGLLIASPEYNSSVSPLLKNTIDWVSRPNGNEPPLACFSGKVAALVAASPGALGGLRGLVHLRSILGNIQVLVLPDQKTVPNAFAAFDENGNLKDEKTRAAIAQIGQKLAETVRKLAN